MLLKSITINNIRSYNHAKIDLRNGSTLLLGDIGSGKTTILLAIEFALFGSKPSELPASSLLRHGKNEGSVELNFELENKNIIINRTLKKGKNAIKQETGYIIIDDIKKELSPVEMKSEVFNLLGYPEDLVAKGKDLLYRYTVYTPQEEMKRILIEDKDARLNTLRKVFNIDKYKKIKENSSIFIRGVKEKKKEFEGFISDLEEKRKELGSISKEISGLNEKIKSIIPKVEKAKSEVSKKREKISIYENKVNELSKLKKNFEILELNLSNTLNEHNNNNKAISRLSQQIAELENDLKKEEISKSNNIKEKIKSYYIEQKPSYCGPASASMVLKIFGYNESQSKIGELSNAQVGVGTHPSSLIKVAQDITQNKVKGAWVDVSHITDLKDEIRLWLSEGALIIIDYKKNILFPESKTAHYSVCVAVEGDELVVLDPSGKKGGVYLADAEKVYLGMDTYSELIKGKQ